MSSSDRPIPLVDYLYELPRDLIAHAPAEPRDSSRLMHVRRDGRAPSHHRFCDLPDLLRDDDLLVTNETQVIPARLRLHKTTGGRVELLLLRPLDGVIADATTWEGMGRPGEAFVPGRQLVAGDGSALTVVGKNGRAVRVQAEEPILQLAQRVGEVPLPPYIDRPSGPDHRDRSDYQAVFAREPGSAAAPTASLHFTPELLERLKTMGVVRTSLVLHVGLGTFLPIDDGHADDVRAQSLHAEWFSIPASTVEQVHAARSEGRRVVAVGSTVVRALETLATTGKSEGETDLYIYPGHRFRAVDAMITNFHLPGTTLLLMVAAFAGPDVMRSAYKLAVAERYRFFSFGDAMLID